MPHLSVCDTLDVTQWIPVVWYGRTERPDSHTDPSPCRSGNTDQNRTDGVLVPVSILVAGIDRIS